MVVYVIVSVIISLVIIYITLRFVIPDVVKKATEQLIQMADQKLGAEKQEIKTDLENKKEAIETIVEKIAKDLEKNRERLQDAEKERVGSFRALKQELETQRKITEQLSTTTESLKRVLSNNQLRGQFGEQVAENLLKMNGFVKGVDYDVNKEMRETGTRPDFTVYLPNKIKINIDAKFPYQKLQQMVESEDQNTKKELLKIFEGDIKTKIKQVTSRDYINPQENTVDFVIMFVPNEMIFSFIYERMNEVWLEAMKQKVVLTGPFSFTAILRLVRQAYDNFRYQKNIQKIIGYIKTFEAEFQNYNNEFEIIGDRIDSLSKKYDEVSTTRTNKLLKSIEKIRIEEGSSENKLLQDKKLD